MVIANEKIVQPASPPKRWGVEVRPRTLKDYRSFALALSIFLIFLFLIVSPGWFGVDLSKDSRLAVGLFLVGPAGITALVTLSDPGRVLGAANDLARQRSYQWQQDVLFPFLEAKYGITIPEQSLNSFGWNRAYKDNRTIEFNPHGVIFENDNFVEGSDDRGFDNIRLTDVWLEEVVRPDQVSFRAMEEV